MKVYDQTKTKLLETYDLEKGYLKEDTLIINHKEIPEIKEIGHYETTNFYSNGGQDVVWVVDVAAQDYQAAYVEEEKIQLYIPYTTIELNKIEAKKKISELKKYLAETDYISNKLAEAACKYMITNNDSEIKNLLSKYEIVLQNRQKYRQDISILELSL